MRVFRPETIGISLPDRADIEPVPETGTGAFLTTSLPALAAVGRWPWAALGLVLLYPVAWIGIMMQR